MTTCFCYVTAVSKDEALPIGRALVEERSLSKRSPGGGRSVLPPTLEITTCPEAGFPDCFAGRSSIADDRMFDYSSGRDR
jgi:hypothetical protein